MCITSQADYSLSAEQVEQFHRDGFIGPFAACTTEEMDLIREHVQRVVEVAPKMSPDGLRANHNRHLDDRALFELCRRPEITDRMASIVGPDLFLWRTHFFTKEPGGKEVPWHQDYNYWPIEPAVVASAWIAFDLVDQVNSCVQLIPGSHRHILPHIPATPDMLFEEMADMSDVDQSNLVEMVLKPGEFFLFNERTLHHSDANMSNRRRMGMAIRCITPIVRVMDYDSPWHGVLQLAGKDIMGFNRIVKPPTTNAV